MRDNWRRIYNIGRTDREKIYNSIGSKGDLDEEYKWWKTITSKSLDDWSETSSLFTVKYEKNMLSECFDLDEVYLKPFV